MTQQEALDQLSRVLGRDARKSGHGVACTGHVDTCPNDECLVCGVRDCPDDEPLHYHHDGCPACDVLD